MNWSSTALPETHVTVEDLVAEERQGGGPSRASVSHSYVAFLGLPPTGKHVTFTEIDIIRIAGGKLVERWAETDMLSLLQQLGVDPPRERARS